MHGGAIGGEQIRDIDCEAAAIKGRHTTPRLGDQQRTGSHVPWLERGGEEAVQPATGDIGEIERCRSGSLGVLRCDEHPQKPIDGRMVR